MNVTYRIFTVNISFKYIEPTTPPDGLKIVDIRKTSAKAKWDLLSIIQPYGVITGYAVRIAGYTLTNPLNATYIVSNQNRKFLLRELMPNSKYSVQVAVVTSAGIGPLSKPVSFFTQGRK